MINIDFDKLKKNNQKMLDAQKDNMDMLSGVISGNLGSIEDGDLKTLMEDAIKEGGNLNHVEFTKKAKELMDKSNKPKGVLNKLFKKSK